MFFFRPTSSVFIVSVAELTHWVFKLCITLCLFFFILLSVWVHIHHSLPVGSLCAVGLGQMLIYSWPELSVCQQRLTQQWYSSFTPSLLLLFGLHCVPLTWALVFVNTPAHVIDVRLSDFPILADQCVYLLTLHHIQPDISTASVIRQQHDVTRLSSNEGRAEQILHSQSRGSPDEGRSLQLTARDSLEGGLLWRTVRASDVWSLDVLKRD